MLLVQELDVEIKDKKGAENAVADHLSWLEREAKPILIRDEFLNKQILHMTHVLPWYTNIYNYFVASTYPKGASKVVKEKLESHTQMYSRVRDPIGPPLLSFSSRRWPLWIRSNSLESLRLWAILAYYFLRCAYYVAIHGLVGEDPHKHLKEFHVVCSTMRSHGIPKDYIKMKAFPFSLDGVAKE
ncbi:hypothetical protein CR513_26989, partial [Mucuna pruriens]